MIERRIPRFDPVMIARSGQCFRMREFDGGAVRARAGDRQLWIKPLGGELFAFDCEDEEFEDFWLKYFDLGTDYAAFENAVDPNDIHLLRAAQNARGLRILRQEPWEALVSFILSQRKSIPAIRGCVEALCDRIGRDAGGYHAFPVPCEIARAGLSAVSACGTGYRAPYVYDAAIAVTTGALDLSALQAADDESLLSALLSLRGVGVKVASCAMLFGFHRFSACPVDVWIARIIDEQYGGVSPFPRYAPFAGIVQQYLFADQMKDRRA